MSQPSEAAATDAESDAPAAPCVLGTRQCNGLQPLRCEANGWVDDGSPCPFACGANGCQGVCATNAHQCSADGLGIETCGADGTWSTAQACAFVCSGGACGGHCTPSTKQCTTPSGDPRRAAGWTANGPRDAVRQRLRERGFAQARAHPDAKQCSNLIPETCNGNGAWVDSTACPFVCSNGGCTGVCTPNDTQCTNGAVQTCSAAGQWGVASPCNFVCSGKVCGGVCAPNDTICLNDTQKETCGADGTYGPATTCPSACVGKTCGGTCMPWGAAVQREHDPVVR